MIIFDVNTRIDSDWPYWNLELEKDKDLMYHIAKQLLQNHAVKSNLLKFHRLAC